MKTVTIECRQINEWDEATQQKIIERHRDINVDHDWWEFVYDDVKEIGAKLGVTIDNIYFAGFWSQGDGACFVGTYQHNPDAPRVIREYAPQDKDLHRIADQLSVLGSGFTVTITHSGRYCHEYCTRFEFSFDTERGDADDIEEDVKYWLRAFMRWTYRQLEKEYEYLTSDEAVRETLAANEYEFDADGRIW